MLSAGTGHPYLGPARRLPGTPPEPRVTRPRPRGGLLRSLRSVSVFPSGQSAGTLPQAGAVLLPCAHCPDACRPASVAGGSSGHTECHGAGGGTAGGDGGRRKAQTPQVLMQRTLGHRHIHPNSSIPVRQSVCGPASITREGPVWTWHQDGGQGKGSGHLGLWLGGLKGQVTQGSGSEERGAYWAAGCPKPGLSSETLSGVPRGLPHGDGCAHTGRRGPPAR